MIIDSIGCLHGHYPTLEGGDLLIVTGDLTRSDKCEQYEEFFEWLRNQKYKKKIFISGNHDNQSMSQFDWYDAEYLYGTSTEYNGLKIFGSPHSLNFPGMNPACKAFTCNTEEEISKKWDLIRKDTDILITHMPPWGILDKIESGKHVGSTTLRSVVLDSEKYPALSHHFFSHIHEEGGKMVDLTMTKFYNCSIMNEKYQPVNKVTRVII